MVCPRCGRENSDDARFCSACAAALDRDGEPEVRKTVTVLFCDLVGSTALGDRTDPEVLRALMSRYHAEARTILERHGGTVEKFVGDAVMAVFGLPRAHEDDALRGVRAAVELRDAVAALGLEARLGVNTGEVVAGGGETLVTGDAVNLAARLEQAADPGEVLVGAATLALVRDAVRADAVAPLALKGKSEPVRAYRLVALLPDVPAFTRRVDAPFVGRAQELSALERALARVIETRSPHLATIIGPPGIGKSRLAREVIHRSGASLLVGRCVSYGDGVTYRPLAEVVAQAGDVGTILSGADGDLAAARVSAAVGHADIPASSEEIAWGFRKLFEALARASPLVVVLDDVHWAEPALLDLIEYVAAFASDAPLFLLCLARHDLLDRRPEWAAARPNSTLVTLDPLGEAETEMLVDALGGVSGPARRRVVEAAEGNPLFVEQFLAMRADGREGELEVPATIQALLAARIDRLDADERAVVERGSVEGRLFHRGSVAALLAGPAQPKLGSCLLALVRKELLRPDRATLPGDDAFRFAHALVRDAAYDSIPKRVRADLHERLGAWVDATLGDDARDALVGYHLEQAYRYRNELGVLDADAEALADRAAARLAAAGERAYALDDTASAAGLLERALALPWEGAGRRVELGLRLAAALLDVGRTADAERAAGVAATAAAAAADEAGKLRAELFLGQIAVFTTGDYGALLPLAERALPLFDDAGDDRGSMEAWRVIALDALFSERYADAAAAFEHAVARARRLGSPADERELLGWVEYSLFHGPMPVDEILRWADTSSLPPDRLEPAASSLRALLRVLAGGAAEARALYERNAVRLEELGIKLWLAVNAEFAWNAEMLAGDLAAAERQARRGCALYEEIGSPVGIGVCAGMLGQTLYAQGRLDEALHWTEVSEENAGGEGIGIDSSGRRWRQARAKVLASRGALEQGEELARDAVRWAERTDSLRAQADASLDLADVLALAGRRDDAAVWYERGAVLYERKGIAALATRARSRLHVA